MTTNPATRAGLAALEPLEGVIDKERFLEDRTDYWAYKWNKGYSPVSAVVSLAIRLQQAREWVEKWCNEHNLALRIVMEAGQWIVNIAGELYSGGSLAEALAATIAALQEQCDVVQ